jgi:hypothetical protein
MATTAGGGCCWVVFEDDIGPWHPERARAHRDIKKTLENLNEADVIVRIRRRRPSVRCDYAAKVAV